MTTSPLYEKNLTLLRENFPEVYETVRAVGEPLSSIVWDGDKAADIDLGAGRLYKMDGEDFVRQQLDQFFETPERIFINEPDESNLHSDYSARLLKFLKETIAGHGIEALPEAPEEDVGLLVVIGVGLGLHLAELIERTRPRHVLVIEPIHEFLLQSLHATDWSAVKGLCDEVGCSLDLIAEDDPKAAISAAVKVVQGHGVPFIDGCYIFLHYRTSVSLQIRNDFRVQAAMLTIARGYYEDEVMMVTNLTRNFTDRKFRYLDGARQPLRPEPVFIVASGPSIDQTIETVSRYRDKAIIISSSSSLQVLLANGIKPDYHVEKENLPFTSERLRYIKKALELETDTFQGIPLIASATVDPGVLELFDEHYLFFRDSVSSTRIFGGGRKMIEGIGPFAANTALTVAATLGFRNVFLFGCDCGSKPGEAHHSEQTHYFTNEQYAGPKVVEYEFTAPANFGGTVETNSSFEWSRSMFEQIIGLYDMTAFNCSDGALIQGAHPLLQADLKLDYPDLDKQAVAQDLQSKTQAYAAGSYLQDQDLEAMTAAWDDFAGDMAGLLQAARVEDQDFGPFFRRVKAFAGKAREDYRGVPSMLAGSMLGLAQLAQYFLCRINDRKIRGQVLDAFIGEYTAALQEMCENGKAIFEQTIAATLEDGPK